MSEQLLTYEDLSRRWKIPVSTLRNWKMKGKLRPLKLGRLVRFHLSYIIALEASGVI